MTRVVPAVIASLLAVTGCTCAVAAGASYSSPSGPGVDAAPLLAASTPVTPTPASTPVTSTSSLAVRLHSARSFAFALGAPLTARNISRLGKRDLVVVDGEDATAAAVAKLRAHGTIVLGYLSVGSVESWRSWFPLLKSHRLEPLGDWDGERYADVSNAELRDALADTIAPSLLSKGFDGLFLDLVDMVEDHPQQADGMYDVVSRIAARVHGAGELLMAQNGDSIISRFLPLLDGWNREDPTGTYDFDHKRYVLTDAPGRRAARATLRTVRAAGLVTTTTDYFATPSDPSAKRAIRLACSVGAIPNVGDIALSKVPRAVVRCPATSPAR